MNRSVWTIVFSGSLRPEELGLTLVSEGGPLTIYDCSFPVVLDAQGTSAKIVVGRQPPLPLSVKLTLPADTRAKLRVHAANTSDRNVELIDSLELAP